MSHRDVLIPTLLPSECQPLNHLSVHLLDHPPGHLLHCLLAIGSCRPGSFVGSCLAAANVSSQITCCKHTISNPITDLASAASGKRHTSCGHRDPTMGYILNTMLLSQIHFISASCENMIDGKGMLPGDVLTASNGKTVEVSSLKQRYVCKHIMHASCHAHMIDQAGCRIW